VPSKLTENLNSLYFGAANALKSNKKKKRVVAYVEGYDDVYFWRDILSEYETEDLMFEVCLPSNSNLSRGKKSVLTNELGNRLGKYMIACVDADYDFLVQGASDISKEIISNPYIFHTYVYAIESYHCYSPSLHNVCVDVTLNDNEVFDFEDYLKAYSLIIYDLFLWSVWFHKNLNANEFTMTKFCNLIKVHNLNTFHPENALESMRKQVNREMSRLQQQDPEAKGHLKKLAQELYQLGVTPENTYLYINGHHLLTNVVKPALEPICKVLINQREKEIKRNAAHRTQENNELASYEHSQMSIDQALKRNTYFKNSSQFQQLKKDIEEFVDAVKNDIENNKMASQTTKNEKNNSD